MSELFCTKCGKLHESESEVCEYCGYNLKEAFERFKTKKNGVKNGHITDSSKEEIEEKEATGMEFYERIK